MIREVAVISTIDVPCPKEQALRVVWDIKTIEITEVKADAVTVHPGTERKGTYDVQGHFAGVPWQNSFAYELNDKGFHSQDVNPPASGPMVSGGFIVEETGENSCKIIHYEQYVLPWRFLALKPFIILYLKWSMWKELRDMKNLIFQKAALTQPV